MSHTPSNLPTLVSRDVIAQMLGVSPLTVWRQAQRGMPHVRIGRSLRFDPVAVWAWVSAASHPEPQAEAPAKSPARPVGRPRKKPLRGGGSAVRENAPVNI